MTGNFLRSQNFVFVKEGMQVKLDVSGSNLVTSNT